jgi:phage tail sheath protein FI
MTQPTFGISIQRQDNEPRIPSYADMSVVGIIGTAPAANLSTFPLDAPVSFFSNDTDKLTALGATGTIRQAINRLPVKPDRLPPGTITAPTCHAGACERHQCQRPDQPCRAFHGLSPRLSGFRF